MAAGRFDRELPLPEKGLIPIKGWFDPQDPEVKEARVVFLIVQGDGEDAVIVECEGTWQRPSDKWSGKAPRTGPCVGGGTGALKKGHARGIALAIVIKPAMLLDGKAEWPAFETLQWCANFRFV
jgi:hypothetical protein